MSSTLAAGGTREVYDQLVDLICDDADLLATEFDAIIAAEWPDPPADPPPLEPTGRRPTKRLAHRPPARNGSTLARPQQPDAGGQARQRAPPFTAPSAMLRRTPGPIREESACEISGGHTGRKIHRDGARSSAVLPAVSAAAAHRAASGGGPAET